MIGEMNLSELARKAGIDPSTLNRWWNGSRKPMKYATLKKLADAMGMSTDELHRMMFEDHESSDV